MRKALELLVVAVIIGASVAVVGLLRPEVVDAQQGPSATRSLSETTVSPGDEFTVTINAQGYGAAGRVQETLPAGFSYVAGSTVPGPQDIRVTVVGQQVRFDLAGDNRFTYRVTASDTAGAYPYNGVVRNIDGVSVAVTGDTSITVEVADGQAHSATRSLSETTVSPGDEFTVTINAQGYGAAGRVQETLPAGFSYVTGSTVPGPQDIRVTVVGQQVRFDLAGDNRFTYRVTASDTAGAYPYNGVVRNIDGVSVAVTGDTSITVEAADAQAHSATRSLSETTVSPGDEFTVTINAQGYGAAGRVQETLPAGFSYVTGSTVPGPQDIRVTVVGQQVRFDLAGDNRFTYRVTASDTAGAYPYNGVVRNIDGVSVAVTGDTSITVSDATTPTPPSSRNVAPVFRSPEAVSVAENTTMVGAVRATDRDSQDSVTGYTITGGADEAKFALVSTRVLTFTTAPDYEVPTDADANNEYVVMVMVTSGTGSRERTATQTITATVTNGDDPGTVTLVPSQPVTGTALTAMLEDPDGETAMVEWKWASSDAMAGTFTNISGATAASYTPREAVADDPATTDVDETYAGDVGMYLQATAMYNDGHDDDKSAMMVTDNAVIVAPADMCIQPLGTLTASQTVMGTWASDCASQGQANNYARYYTFTLSEETRVAIYLTSGRDTYLYLRQGEGRTGRVEHQNNNVGRGSINSRIEETLPMGTYTVEATTYYRRAVTGTFTLDVRPVVRVQELGTLTETYTTPALGAMISSPQGRLPTMPATTGLPWKRQRTCGLT